MSACYVLAYITYKPHLTQTTQNNQATNKEKLRLEKEPSTYYILYARVKILQRIVSMG